MIDSAELIKKVRFPRQLVAFSMVATQAVTFVVMVGILIVLSLVFVPEARTTVWTVIPLAVLFAALVAGLALLVACVNVLFRDVEHILTAALLPWFFLTPVLWSIATLPEKAKQHTVLARRAALGQPVAPPIYAVRDALWSGELPRLADVVYLTVAAVLALRSARSSSAASTTASRSSSSSSSDAQHDPPVVDPRLVLRRGERRQPRDLAERLQLDPGQHRRAEQRRREARARGRGQARTAPARAAAGAAATPATRSRRRRRRSPRRARLATRSAQSGAGSTPLGQRRVRLPSRGPTSTSCGEHRAAELREPGAQLGDHVEREPVAAGRDRHADRRLDGGALPRRERGHRVARPVPDDRVVAVVEPVRGEEDLVAPRQRAGVRHLHASRSRSCPPATPPGAARPSGRREVPSTRLASLTAVEPLLVRAARREPVERTPVWFMRQAGRSLPEYRAIRERHSFWEVAHTPELCAEVTLQPVRRHGVDAAVMFADIMTPVLGMGLDVDLVEGVGPVIAEPVRTLADVERLRVPEPAEAFAPLLEAIRIVRGELEPEQAVVGFCGGPFTVAGYLVEGKPSREFATVKTMMYSEPARLERADGRSSPTASARTSPRRRRPAPTSFSSSTRGSARSRRPTTRSSSRPGRRRSSPRSTCRRSTSARAPRRCCLRWQRRAAT